MLYFNIFNTVHNYSNMMKVYSLFRAQFKLRNDFTRTRNLKFCTRARKGGEDPFWLMKLYLRLQALFVFRKSSSRKRNIVIAGHQNYVCLWSNQSIHCYIYWTNSSYLQTTHINYYICRIILYLMWKIIMSWISWWRYCWNNEIF